MSQILVILDRPDALRPRLPVALYLRQIWGSELICAELSVALISRPLGAASRIGDGGDEDSATTLKTLDMLSTDNFVWTWMHAGALAEITAAAALSELVLCGPGGADSLACDLVKARHDLTVIIPAESPSVCPPSRTVIAWDGGPAILNTVVKSLRLLQHAEAVLVMTVRDGPGLGSDVAVELLARHGVAASVTTVQAGLGTIDAYVEAECRRWNAGWCLLGADHRGDLEGTPGRTARRMIERPSCILVIGR